MTIRKFLSTATLIVLVLAVGAGLYFSFIDPYTSRLVQARFGDLTQKESTVGELEDATYLLSPVNGGGIYHEGELTFEDYFANGSLVLDLAISSSGVAKLLHNVVADTHDVTINGNTLISSKLIKKFLFVSKDGTRVAVAVKDIDGVVTDPKSWRIFIADTVSRETWEIEGFGAVFIDTTTVLAFRQDGVFAVQYETGEETTYLNTPSILAHKAIAQSASGTKVAWTTIDGQAEVFEIIQNTESPMVRIASFKEVLGSLALSDENLYELEDKSSGGTSIVRYALFSNNESMQVRSLPSILAVRKFIP